LEIKDHLGVLKRQLGLILSFVGLAIVLTILALIRAPQLYQSEAILRIKRPINLRRTLLQINQAGNPRLVNQRLATYIQIMKSRMVIEKVIKRIKWNDFVKKNKNNPKIIRPKYKAIRRRFVIKPIKNTELLKVKVRARKPQQAEIMVNSLVAVFIDRITFLTRFEQRMVRKFIATRLEYSKKQTEKAESLLTAFKSETQIFTPTTELKQYMKRLSEIDQRLAENDLEMAIAKARLGNIARQIGKFKPEYWAENAMIELYRSKLAALELQLVELTQRSAEQHPEIMACRAQIAVLKDKLDMEIKRVITMDAASANPLYQSLLEGKLRAETAMAVSTVKKAALDKVLDQEEAAIIDFTAKEQELIRLMRDVAVAQDIYLLLARRFEEARIVEVMQPTDLQIVDQAAVSKEAVKNVPMRKILIIFCGNLFLGVGLAYTLDYLNKFIYTEGDVKHYLDLPVLGKIPGVKYEDRNIVGNLKSFR
jgi:succinoglycan biosynthesis transport protein ExoP